MSLLVLLAGLLQAAATAPPPQTAAEPITLAKQSEATLDNGLHLLVLEDRRQPIVTFQLVIRGAGGYYDPDDQPGLATATAALLREGTQDSSAAEIGARLSEIGATLTFAAPPGSPDFVMSGSCPSEHATKLLDLATEIVLRPAFADESLDRYKLDLPMTLLLQREDPAFTAREIFAKAVYDTHPGSRVASDTASLDGITRERVVAFHRAHYAPDHAVLAVDGDVSPFGAKFYIGQKLGDWKRVDAEPPAVADPAPPEQPRILLIGRPGSEPTALIIGAQAVSRTSDDYDALNVMNAVAGGTLVAPAYAGEWYLEAKASPDSMEPTLQELLQKIRSLRDERVEDDALSAAKRAIVDGFRRSLDAPDELAGYLAAEWTHKLPAGYWDTFVARVEGVTAEQVQAAAQKYLAADRLQIVVAGSEPAQRD